MSQFTDFPVQIPYITSNSVEPDKFTFTLGTSEEFKEVLIHTAR